ncbi:putative glutathione S-transferase [Sesbania bispinosa]|nr:putative glutathione S-transferase [Sesbania bispinosa]
MSVENNTPQGEEGDVVQKKKRVGFTDNEDKLLIQSCLNISKDVVGVNQKSYGFWLRITGTYNEHRYSLEERKEGQLKSRWQKLNTIVQKFSGCYKQACNVKQSGSPETDIMATAYEIYMKDEVPDAYQERTDAIEKLARIKEEEVTTRELEILFKDTTEMNEEQFLVHKWFCQKIKRKYGIS